MRALDLRRDSRRRAGAGEPRQLEGFDRDDLVFRRLADLVALAIENARLRDEFGVPSARGGQPAQGGGDLDAGPRDAHAVHLDQGLFDCAPPGRGDLRPGTRREFLQIIDEECGVLEDIIHDLLESSIIDAGF